MILTKGDCFSPHRHHPGEKGGVAVARRISDVVPGAVQNLANDGGILDLVTAVATGGATRSLRHLDVTSDSTSAKTDDYE